LIDADERKVKFIATQRHHLRISKIDTEDLTSSGACTESASRTLVGQTDKRVVNASLPPHTTKSSTPDTPGLPTDEPRDWRIQKRVDSKDIL